MGQSGRGLRASKGEDEADDVKRQVDSDDNCQKPIYQLLNVKNGGGKLVDIIKSCSGSSSGSFATSKSMDLATQRQTDSGIDQQIRELVEPLLYNEGRGKLVPLSCLWNLRLRKSAGVEEEDIESAEAKRDKSRHRLVCWRLDELGFVGETALHICFLLSTSTHMILARKLLSLFPMLINDIYACDQYFGESSLHMAIVHENMRVVKMLLDHGANVHERCLGKFFLPNDQKDRANGQIKRFLERKDRQDSQVNLELDRIDLHSNHFSTTSTDYDGYAYWGEYPLSFAACLGLSDCYKLLLAKGADPNRQDSNGNATIHMTVIANRIDLFDLCFSNGANLDIVNNQQLTPLTLAAKLRRVDMFFHILKVQRQVNWIFCNVGFADIPLAEVDSINIQDGSCNDESVLSIVVFGTSNEHLEMLNGLLSQLLEVKWETAVRGKFYWWLYQFLAFLLISLVAYITRLDDQSAERILFFGTVSNRDINTYSEYLLICFVIYYLQISIRRIVHVLEAKTLSNSLARAPEMTMFMFTCFLVLACIPLRMLNLKQAEDTLAALIIFLIPLKLLFFCRASKSVGPFVVMIYKIVVNDVLCFVVFLVIFVAGFSQSFSIIFKTHKPQPRNDNSTEVDKNYFSNLFDGVISMHLMALNEFTAVFDEFDSTDYPKLARVIFCIYMILASILLINMLIAMLGKTYQDIASQPNESLRQWARALLTVERMWTDKERLKMLDRYSQRRTTNSLDRRYYGSTWALSPIDRNEITEMKQLNAENRLGRLRLANFKQRWTSSASVISPDTVFGQENGYQDEFRSVRVP